MGSGTERGVLRCMCLRSCKRRVTILRIARRNVPTCHAVGSSAQARRVGGSNHAQELGDGIGVSVGTDEICIATLMRF